LPRGGATEEKKERKREKNAREATEGKTTEERWKSKIDGRSLSSVDGQEAMGDRHGGGGLRRD